MEKCLLVVGASSDMGVQLIEDVHDRYEKIAAHYCHMNPKLEALQRKLGSKLCCLQADLTDEGQVRSMVDKIKELDLQPEHICHFPAGSPEYERFNKIPWEVFQRQMDITFKSLVLVSQAFIPAMAKKKRGKIVVMLSYAVQEQALAHCAAYVSAKYALLGLVRALAAEYASKGITINGVSPDAVATRYVQSLPEYLVHTMEQASPAGRLMDPREVVPTMEYLLSPAADFITGQNIFITGGTRR